MADNKCYQLSYAEMELNIIMQLQLCTSLSGLA